MTKSKRLALIILTVIASLVAVYFLLKWTAPKDCIAVSNRTAPECRDYIYPTQVDNW